MACNKISRIDQISRLDRCLTEPEMGNGDATGLLRVICKKALGIEIGIVTDYFDGSVICSHGTI